MLSHMGNFWAYILLTKKYLMTALDYNNYSGKL